MTTNTRTEPALYRENRQSHGANRADIPVVHRGAGRHVRTLSQGEKLSLTGIGPTFSRLPLIEPQDQRQPMRRNNSLMASELSSRAAAEAAFEFGRFRVLLRQRQVTADGVPLDLGTRALDALLVLLEANGSLVTKDELISRVWPGVVVTEENLKVQISALRKALGEDRDFIRTEFGRGYRFTAAVRSTVAARVCQRRMRRRRSSQR
jgi:DNA-binding winged helix-turn-helix (wHTH) protein